LKGKTCKIGDGDPAIGEGLLVVTSKDRLRGKFGTSGYRQIENAILALNGRILDVSASDYGEVDDRIEAVGRKNISTILIVGGHDVVPFSVIFNPVIDGDILYTDDVYGDFDHDADTIIDVPIARIPDGGDLDLVLTQLSSSSPPASGSFALANYKRPAAEPVANTFGAHILWSIPTRYRDLHAYTTEIAGKYGYYMLHGSKGDTTTWWGEKWKGEKRFPDPAAFKVHQANSRGIVLAGCCYGAYVIDKNPGNSICLAFLENGARCFVGCTGKHYSTSGKSPDAYGQLFHKMFFANLMGGNTPMQAFYETKVAYAARATYSAEKKIMHEFVYYGRP